MKKLLVGTAALSILLAGCGQGEEQKKEETKTAEVKTEEKVTTEKSTTERPTTEKLTTEASITEKVTTEAATTEVAVNSNQSYKNDFYPTITALIDDANNYWDNNWFDTFNPIKETNDGSSYIDKVTEIKDKMSSYTDEVYNLEAPDYFTGEQKIYFEDFKKNLNFAFQKKMMAAAYLEQNINNNEVDEDKNMKVTEKAAEANKYYSEAMQSLDMLNKSFK